MSLNGMETDKWVNTDEGTYYFGSNGRAYKGWKTVNGIEFYFGKDGKIQREWTTIDGKKYFLQEGVATKGPIYIDGVLYNFGEQDY